MTSFAQECNQLTTNPTNHRPALPNFDPTTVRQLGDGFVDVTFSQKVSDLFTPLIHEIEVEQLPDNKKHNFCKFECTKMDAKNYFRDDPDAPGILKLTSLWSNYEYHIHLNTFESHVENNRIAFSVSGMVSAVIGFDLRHSHTELTACRNLSVSIKGILNPTLDNSWRVEPHATVEVDIGACGLDLKRIILTGGFSEEIARQAVTALIKGKIADHLANVIRKKIDDDTTAPWRGTVARQLEVTWQNMQTPKPMSLSISKHSYVLLEPKRILATDSPIQFSSGNINFKAQVALRPTVFLNEIPAETRNSLPNRTRERLNSTVAVPVEVRLDFDTSSSLLEKSLMAKQPLKPVGLNILGADVNGSGKYFLVKLKVDGKFRGMIYASGQMSLNGNEVRSSCLNFQVEAQDPTKADEVKFIRDVLNEPHIVKVVQEKMTLDLIDTIEEVRTSMSNSMNSSNPNTTITFQGKSANELIISPQDVFALKNEGFRLLMIIKDK